jgi:hypothetical protein
MTNTLAYVLGASSMKNKRFIILKLAVQEILDHRRPNNCEPLTILNNLLRWSLYQVIH